MLTFPDACRTLAACKRAALNATPVVFIPALLLEAGLLVRTFQCIQCVYINICNETNHHSLFLFVCLFVWEVCY